MTSAIPEFITEAAVRREGEVWSVPRPGRHHNVLQLVSLRVGREREGWEQGFLTSSGRFVDRYEAFKIATAANQIIEKTPGPKGMLFSEDVW